MMQMSQFRQSQYNPMTQVDALRQDLMRAQTMGADPMTMGRLQQELQMAERKVQEFYARQMMEIGQPPMGGNPGIGGAPGAQSQQQQNPYLAMLLQAQLGGSGGRGGGPMQ